jgi:SPX domain protein involved in polyphosphate accumulation
MQSNSQVLQMGIGVPQTDARAETFVRIEDKFLIPRERSTELFRLLDENLDPSYPNPGMNFNLIESLYFDTDNLDVYRSHFMQLDTRFKMRIRRYATNGEWKDDAVHLELKAKEMGVSKKARFKIGPSECSVLALGQRLPLSLELVRRNQKLGALVLLKRMSRINNLVTRLSLRPQGKVTYVRRAYERDGLRVTVDDQIRYQMITPPSAAVRQDIAKQEIWKTAQAMRETFRREDHLVLEVKHSGVVPEWVTKFVQGVGREKASFSKYCFSISDHLIEEGAHASS